MFCLRKTRKLKLGVICNNTLMYNFTGSGATADCLDDGGSVSASHIDTLPSVLNAETLSEDIREAQPAPDTLNAVDTDALPSTEPAENIIVEVTYIYI
jgi:hypothetical protein